MKIKGRDSVGHVPSGALVLPSLPRHVSFAVRHSNRPAREHAANLPDRLCRIQPFRADVRAVQDRPAAKEAIRIVEIIEPLARGFVARVDQKAIGL